MLLHNYNMIFLKRKSVSLTDVTILLKSVRMMRKNPLSLLFFLTKAPPLPLLLSKELNKQQRNSLIYYFIVCDFLLLFLICQVKSNHNWIFTLQLSCRNCLNRTQISGCEVWLSENTLERKLFITSVLLWFVIVSNLPSVYTEFILMSRHITDTTKG